MADPVVTSEEFRRNTGKLIEISGKISVTITKHKRSVRVLIEIDAYEGHKYYH